MKMLNKDCAGELQRYAVLAHSPILVLASMRTSLPRAIAVCTFLVVFLAGCKFNLQQVSSATVEPSSSERLLQAKELSPNQVRALSTWFSQHNTGWSSSVASYVPMLLIRAKHTDGDTSVINIMSNMVVVYNRTGQYQQQFTPSELAQMRRILETQ